MRRAALALIVLAGCGTPLQTQRSSEGACWLNHSGVMECASEMTLEQLQDVRDALSTRDTTNGADIAL